MKTALLILALACALVPTVGAQQFVSITPSNGCSTAQFVPPYTPFDLVCAVYGFVLPVFFPPVVAGAEVSGICIGESILAGGYTWWSQNIEAQATVVDDLGKTQATMDCSPIGACVSTVVRGRC